MFFFFIFLTIYLPFQIALNPGFNFDLASIRILIIFFFIFLIIDRIIKKSFFKKEYFFNFQSVCLFLFLILTTLSLIGANNISWGLRKIAFFLSLFPLYLISIFLINRFKKFEKIISSLIIGGFFLALIGLIQFFSQFVFGLEETYNFWAVNILPVFSGFNLGAMILNYPSWLVNVDGETVMRAFSVFSDPHMLSFYLGMMLPLLIGLIYFKRAKKIFNIVGYFLFFIILLLTFARGSYIALIFSFLILSFLFWKFLNNKRMPLLLLVSLLIFIIPITPVSDRFYSTFSLTEGSNAGRLEMWRTAGEIGMNNFWTGTGLGNYSLAADFELDYRNPATAHNLYLDIFSETGFGGLFIWLILFFGVIWKLFKKLKKTKNEEQKCFLISLIGSLSYFFIHSFFETAIFQPSVLALIMIILGLANFLLKNDQETN